MIIKVFNTITKIEGQQIRWTILRLPLRILLLKKENIIEDKGEKEFL